MVLNQKVRYGVGCLYELSKTPHEYTQGDSIAHRQLIPAAYTHKVLQSLARAGLVYSQKGLGYKLARALSSITARDVIDALTLDEDPNSTNPDLGLRLEERLNEWLEKITLDQVVITQR